jgi:cytochrome c oxidase cbb3-type subunit II
VNRGPFIFLGILATMALSFWGLIFIPQMQIGQQEQTVSIDTGELYPAARSGLAKRGAEVYRAEGCVECHTQQVRDRSVGTDFERGWGPRFTVAQDYLGDYPVMLGLQRVGPDLANVAVTKPDANWHLRHLYDSKALVRGSMMPPYRYLFEKRRLTSGQKPSDRALKVDKVSEGYEIVPTEDADALVAYLLSLRSTAEFWEAPIPRPPGAVPASSTNAAPGAATNTTNAAAAPANPPVVPPSAK